MTNDSHDPPLPTPPTPSVLDYVKSRLSFGRRPSIELPTPEEQESVVETAADRAAVIPEASAVPRVLAAIPWRPLSAMALALLAQSLYEPPRRAELTGGVAYVLAIGFLCWAALRHEWVLPSPAAREVGSDPLSYRRAAFSVSLPLAALAFLLFAGNLFTALNLTLWLAALGLFVWSLWLPDPNKPSLWRRLTAWLTRSTWEIRFDRWTLLVLAAVLLVVFFRLYHLQQTPAEPFSDHAEKLLDVYDISQGQTHIFFPRNTGREAIQMYWTLLVSWVFGTGFSFLSLKLGTVLIGLLTLPYVYVLGKEVGGRRVGLLALVLTGIAYWPNVISRVGLRFPLYPMFVAPLMLYLIRGLRRRNRNDFIIAGIFLGLGMHGYSPFRIVPLLVIAAVVLYMLHPESKGTRQTAILWLVIVAVVSLIIFLPLLRYATENPDSFSYRALTRLANLEQPLPAPWYQIFLSNTWNALTLFNWDNGDIWVHSLPDRPALDMVTGALFLLGVVLLLVRYARTRQWPDIFLLLSIPILLLPSILSLAFPEENPSLNRTAGALVPAFLVAALALDGFISVWTQGGRRSLVGYALIAVLLATSALQNYDLVFRQYDQEFRNSAWNTSEMGAVIKQFGLVYGETDTAWVVPFPYWVDTRLVGVWAGIPNRDFALWTDQLPESLEYTGPKLFLARANMENPDINDQKAVDALKKLYPQGSLSLHRSAVPGHDFWIYFVPALSSP
jgi:4-amino-4-deoxy-L-arabinose transferase-like glycosyltransferase